MGNFIYSVFSCHLTHQDLHFEVIHQSPVWDGQTKGEDPPLRRAVHGSEKRGAPLEANDF